MMMRNALMLTLAATVAAACETRDDTDFDTDVLPGEETTTDPVRPAGEVGENRWQFESTEEAGDRQVSGTAELRHDATGTGEGAELRVDLQGLSEGEHAWHIHRGSCDDMGEVALPFSHTSDEEGVADNLSVDSDGRAEETVSLDREHLTRLQAGETYSLNVHERGGEDHGPAVACANIEWTGHGATATTPAAPRN